MLRSGHECTIVPSHFCSFALLFIAIVYVNSSSSNNILVEKNIYSSKCHISDYWIRFLIYTFLLSTQARLVSEVSFYLESRQRNLTAVMNFSFFAPQFFTHDYLPWNACWKILLENEPSRHRPLTVIDGSMLVGFRLVNTKCMALIDVWKKLQHSNIVQLREVFTTKAFGDHCKSSLFGEQRISLPLVWLSLLVHYWVN